MCFIRYLNLEIARQAPTALSGAQYLKVTLASRNLLPHSPYAKVYADILVFIIRVFGKDIEYFKKSSNKSKL